MHQLVDRVFQHSVLPQNTKAIREKKKTMFKNNW